MKQRTSVFAYFSKRCIGADLDHRRFGVFEDLHDVSQTHGVGRRQQIVFEERQARLHWGRSEFSHDEGSVEGSGERNRGRKGREGSGTVEEKLHGGRQLVLKPSCYFRT